MAKQVFFVDYHALKERLYEIDEGGAASFEVSLGVQLTSKETTTMPTSSHNPVVKFLGLIDAEFEKVNKYVEPKTKSMLAYNRVDIRWLGSSSRKSMYF